jgi:hypothetical protein
MYSCIARMKIVAVAIGLSMITAHVVADDKTLSCRARVEVLAGSPELSFFDRQTLTNLIRRNNHAGIQARCLTPVGMSGKQK